MLNLLRYLFVLLAIIVPVAAAQAAEPLPSWNDGPTKKAIEAFVKKVTDEGGPDYVPPAVSDMKKDWAEILPPAD